MRNREDTWKIMKKTSSTNHPGNTCGFLLEVAIYIYIYTYINITYIYIHITYIYIYRYQSISMNQSMYIIHFYRNLSSPVVSFTSHQLWAGQVPSNVELKAQGPSFDPWSCAKSWDFASKNLYFHGASMVMKNGDSMVIQWWFSGA